MIDVTARAPDGASGVQDVEAGTQYRTVLAVFAFAATLAYGTGDVFARPDRNVPPATVEAGGGGSVEALPARGAAVFVGLAPSVQTPRNVQAGVGAATWAGQSATVATPRAALPGVGAGTWAGIAPTVAVPRVVLPGVGAIAATGLAPTVQVPRNVTPGVGVAVFAGSVPTVQSPRGVLAGVGSLIATGFAPTVETTAGGGVEVTPGTGAAVMAGYAPGVETSATAPEMVGVITRFLRKRQPEKKPEVVYEGFAPTVTVRRAFMPPPEVAESVRAVPLDEPVAAPVVQPAPLAAPVRPVVVAVTDPELYEPELPAPYVPRKASTRHPTPTPAAVQAPQEPGPLTEAVAERAEATEEQAIPRDEPAQSPVVVEAGYGEVRLGGWAPSVDVTTNTYTPPVQWTPEQDDDDMVAILLLLAAR